MQATAVAPSANTLDGLIDLKTYPIDALDSETGRALIAQCRSQLGEDGCDTVRLTHVTLSNASMGYVLRSIRASNVFAGNRSRLHEKYSCRINQSGE